MGAEYISSGRQTGKTYYLAQRVAELQDEYPDRTMVVIVPTAQFLDQWIDLIWEVGIDPSRLIIHTVQSIEKARGQRFHLVGVDNEDLMPLRWEQMKSQIGPSMLNDDPIVTRSI